MKKKDLRIVFMGTPEFAVDSLRILVENKYNIVGVVTVPDKPAGRGLKLQMSAVKKYALSQGISVLQPTSLKSKSFINQLQELNHNLQVVVAFRILPKAVFELPQYGSFNLHASLLPHYRGAAPINWAIMNGEKETGVSTFFLQPKVDTGHIILQEKITIDTNETAGSLHNKLMHLGANVVLQTVNAIESGEVSTQQQVISELDKPAPKIFRPDCEIDWSQDTESIDCFIRGLSPYPAAWTILQGKMLKIYVIDTEVNSHQLQAGQWQTDGKSVLKFATKDGFICCKEIQLEGKRRMKIEDFLRGFRIDN